MPNARVSPVALNVPHALSIPEILANIVSCLDRPDCYHCALTCRAWLPLALDALWRNMDSAINVFSILGSMEYDPNKDKDGDAVRTQSFSHAYQPEKLMIVSALFRRE